MALELLRPTASGRPKRRAQTSAVASSLSPLSKQRLKTWYDSLVPYHFAEVDHAATGYCHKTDGNSLQPRCASELPEIAKVVGQAQQSGHGRMIFIGYRMLDKQRFAFHGSVELCSNYLLSVLLAGQFP